jgi:hypothetical protein
MALTVATEMPKTNLKVIAGKATNKIDDDIDSLFREPLTEFIAARKTLAATLKKAGRSPEADRVKALAKPSVSAWTVNQLFWNHREPFDRLMATGESIRQAQTGKKGLNLRTLLDERREALLELSELATPLLRDAGHNPSLDTLRRITTTLEAMTAYASLPEGLSPGRLTKDIDPPGFDSYASFALAVGSAKLLDGPRVNASRPAAAAVKPQGKPKSAAETNRLKKARQAKLAAAKALLQKAKKSLLAARATAKRLEAAQKKADAEAKQAEKDRRDAERRFKYATDAAEVAVSRSRAMTDELELAKKNVDEANYAVQSASTELESLFRES